ncbi:MAG: thioredoxin family protein, partial [Burkholderiales bacterium]
MNRRILLLAAISTGLVFAKPLPYNESADAKAEVRQALAQSSHDKIPVLVIFGANWCEDCRALDVALKHGKNAELMARSFRVVKVDVGNFD